MKYLNNQLIILVIGLLFASSASLHTFTCDEAENESEHSSCQFCENDVSDPIRDNSFVAVFSLYGFVANVKKDDVISDYFGNFQSRAPPINRV
tara:strand:+ start:964 stop:1242 length:279 start_codon:yes stop_codon:yes gene_type:complete